MKQLAAERKPYFYGVGEDVVGCRSLDEIIKKSKLDWEVEKRPISLADTGAVIKGKFATVRKDNEQVLGIVGNGYEVVQNIEGFDFVQDCLGEGITFRKAGTYNRGERVFMVGEAPTVKVMGDDVHPSILFKNSHDGSGGVQAMFTPMRIVCENGLMIPIAGHEKGVVKFSISHTRNVKDRLKIVEELITKNNRYIEELKKQAELLAATPFSEEQFEEMSRQLAGVESTDVKLTRGQSALITDMQDAYNEDDVANFRGTAWGAILAASDYDTHKENSRNTGNTEWGFERVAYGMTVLAAAAQIIAQMTGVGVFRR